MALLSGKDVGIVSVPSSKGFLKVIVFSGSALLFLGAVTVIALLLCVAVLA